MRQKFLAILMGGVMFAAVGCSTGNSGSATTTPQPNGTSTVESADTSAVTETAAATSEAPASQTAAEANAADTAMKLYFWSGIPLQYGPQQAMDAYTALHPNVTFEFEQLGWDAASDTKLVTALMGNDGVDVYMPTRDYLGKAQQGVALDLTDFLAQKNIDLIKETGPDATTYQYNGDFYSIPTTRAKVFWLLNEDLFNAANIPLPNDDWTVTDMMDIAKKLTTGTGANKTYGAYITSNWGNYWRDISDAFMDDTDNFTPDLKQATFDNPVALSSLTRYLQMTDTDKSMPSFSECQAQNYNPSQMLLTEKAAMVYTGSYTLRDVKNLTDYPHTFKTAFVLPPLDPAIDKAMYQATLQDPIMVNPKSKYMDQCLDFVYWLYTDGIQYFIPGGRMPSNTAFTSDQVASAFVAGSEDLFDVNSLQRVLGTNRPTQVVYQGVDQAMTVLDQETQKAMVGQETPEQALSNAQTQANISLSSGS